MFKVIKNSESCQNFYNELINKQFFYEDPLFAFRKGKQVRLTLNDKILDVDNLHTTQKIYGESEIIKFLWNRRKFINKQVKTKKIQKI